MRQSHSDHHDTPENHDNRDENARSHLFEQDVGEWFEESVGNEEDGQAGVVLAGCDVNSLCEAIKFGVADVCTVEKGDEIEEAEPGDEAEVEFPEEFAVLEEVLVL